MNHDVDLKDVNPSFTRLADTVTISLLQSIADRGMDQVLCAIAELKQVFLRAHAEEMRNVDKETNEVARQIDRLALIIKDKLNDDELVGQLTGLARSLEKTGKTIKTLGSTVDPLTP